jgi:hypothetical protein
VKRDLLTLSVAQSQSGKWLTQVRRDEFGLSFPHARTREEAVAWVLETARKEFMDAGPGNDDAA